MEVYAWLPHILNMSVTASVTILAVLLARLLLKRAPKIFSYLLWGVVLFRLLCPVTLSSSVSLLRIFDAAATEAGSMEYIPTDIAYANSPAEAFSADGMAETDKAKEELLQNAEHSSIASGANQVKMPVLAATWVWLCGMAVMLIHSGISLFRLQRKLVSAVCIRNRVYEADYVTSPFVIGILRPRIYLPVALPEKERDYILLHERTHIRRGDHIVKLLFFLALVIHWFNPLVWLAFRLMEKDMEMSCDETVMRHMDGDIRAEYSQSLLGLAIGKNRIAGAPLAFGEGDTKARIKNVMRYHRPAILVVALAVVVVIVLVLVLGSNPGKDSIEDENTIILKNPGVETDTEAQQEMDSLMQELEAQRAAVQQEIESLQEKSAQLQEQYMQQYRLAENWAKAFCDRDGEAILSMSSETLQETLREEELLVMEDGYSSFGWSSPWPWDSEGDYRIVRVTENSAEILFYAWVSDPHITVWEEKLTFRNEENGEMLVNTASLEELDYICEGDTYARAYPDGITGTRMDYLANGAGEALNQNALSNRDSKFYAKLFEPESAAVYLLNLLDNPNKVALTVGEIWDDASVPVTIHFMEDIYGDVTVYMIQPYGEDGIWIPHTGGARTGAADGTATADSQNEIYEISVRSISESGIDGYVSDGEEDGLDGSAIPFADDCIFQVNQSMSGVEYEEVSYDTFAEYIAEGTETMNRPCRVRMEAGKITEISLESAYYRYGIQYNALVSSDDEYKEQQDVAGKDILEQYYTLAYKTEEDVADRQGTEIIEVYTGNIGDGDSGYVFVKDGEGTILYNIFAHTARAGWKNIYLGENKDGVFLMTVHIEDRDDYGEYNYQVFRLGEEGNIALVAGSSFRFGGSYRYDDDLFREWVAELERYLEESRLLLSTQEGSIRTEHVSDADRYNYETLGLSKRR